MRLKLIAKQNFETGEIGWKDSRMPASDIYGSTTQALTLAHDCLEHFAFNSVADEIMAHGAMYWIRYEGGWSGQYGLTLDMEGFAGEWDNLLNGLVMDGGFLPDAPKTRPLDEDVENDISRIIEQGKASCVRNTIVEGEAEPAEDLRRDLERLASVFRAYFRKGYRKAVRRYKGLHGCEVAALFSAFESEIEGYTPEFEGQELVVNVNLRTQSVSVIPQDY